MTDLASLLNVTLSELTTIDKFLKKLEAEDDTEMQELYICKLSKTIEDLVKNQLDAFKNVTLEKRKKYHSELAARFEKLRQQITDANWIELYKQCDRLRALCHIDFAAKPLSFAREALDYLERIASCEQKVFNLVEKLRRQPGLETIFQRQHECLSQRRRKIALACIGTMKATKSSFVNYLLQASICPTGLERTTGRLTKIMYGQKSMVTLMSKDGECIERREPSNESGIQSIARELVKLEGIDRSSSKCHEYVIIQLNQEELRDIELWDIPGFDENTELDVMIEKILHAADLIFSLTPITDDVRSSFVKLMNIALRSDFKNPDDSNVLLVPRNFVIQPGQICFIVTKIDTVESDPNGGVTLDRAVENLRRHITERLPTLEDITQKYFIPMCTSPTYNLIDYHRCHQNFVEISRRFFRFGVQGLIMMRLRYLQDILLELLDYRDIERAIRRQQLLIDSVEKASRNFEEIVRRELGTVIAEIQTTLKTHIESEIKMKPILYDGKFEKKLEDKVSQAIQGILREKQADFELVVHKIIENLYKNIDINPQLSHSLEEACRQKYIENPYQIPIGHFTPASWYHTDGEVQLSFKNSTSFFRIKFFKKIVLDLFSHVNGYLCRTLKTMNKNMDKAIGNVAEQMQSDMVSALMNKIKELSHQIGQKKTSLTQARQNEQYLCIMNYLKTNENWSEIRETFLFIHHALFHTEHGDLKLITRVEPLGSSNFKVYSGEMRLGDSNKKIAVAAKCIPADQFSLEEIRYVKKLDHPKVVKLYGICKYDDSVNDYWIIMERLDAHLEEYLVQRSTNNKLHGNELDHIIKNVLDGLDYLHRQDLVHRDIKPTNILLRLVDNGKPIVKLADFGYVHHIPISTKGTAGYAAPELCTTSKPRQHGLLIGPKVDIYSLGVTIKEMYEFKNLGDNAPLRQFWLEISARCCNPQPDDRPICDFIIKEREKLQS